MNYGLPNEMLSQTPRGRCIFLLVVSRLGSCFLLEKSLDFRAFFPLTGHFAPGIVAVLYRRRNANCDRQTFIFLAKISPLSFLFVYVLHAAWGLQERVVLVGHCCVQPGLHGSWSFSALWAVPQSLLLDVGSNSKTAWLQVWNVASRPLPCLIVSAKIVLNRASIWPFDRL